MRGDYVVVPPNAAHVGVGTRAITKNAPTRPGLKEGNYIRN